MGQCSQPAQVRASLYAQWLAHPHVIALHEAVAEFARERALSYDAAGLDATSKFAKEWLAEHGELPDSGVVIG